MSKLPEEFLKELTRHVTEGWIYLNQSGNLSQYTYSHECQFQKHWNEYTTLSRGLILNAEGVIVARPFSKFFNYSEYADKSSLKDLEILRVTDKIDGSLGIFYFHDGKWRCNTKGSFTSEQSVKGLELFQSIPSHLLSPSYTYLAEIVYPENRICVQYKDTKLHFLTCIENKLHAHDIYGYEIVRALVRDTLESNPSAPIDIARSAPLFSLESCLEFIAGNPANTEGLVVHFANGLRLKFKTEEYLILHKLVSGLNENRVKELLLEKNFDIEGILRMFPEEFQEEINKWAKPLINRHNEIFTYVMLGTYGGSKKEFALSIKDYEPILKMALFMMYDGKNFRDISKAIQKGLCK